jgi:hypothetical protein
MQVEAINVFRGSLFLIDVEPVGAEDPVTQYESHLFGVGFEVLIAVVMKCLIFFIVC